MASVEQHPATTTSNGAAQHAEFAVENPATGETIARVANLGAAEVHELALKGRAAQPAWAAEGFEGRAKVMLRAQKWLTDNRDKVCATIVSETGKTFEDAQTIELGYVAAALGFWAKQAPTYLGDEKIKASSPFLIGKKVISRYSPLGLVGVIGPWNYPLANSFGDVIPALMAGNSVILKPSEVTPLTSLMIAGAMLDCGLPQDVFQVATGLGETGAALVDEVDMIMFTGSTKTGKKVMERAAKTLTPISLELGGKDPMVVLADADVERAANVAAFYSMMNTGQTCISVERVYVEEPVYDEFVQKLTEKVSALRQGVPDGPGSVDVGSLTFPPQIDIVERHVEDARAKGAKILTGGHRKPGAGLFYEPTILTDVDHSMDCMKEETFGPTLPVMRVKDTEEAIRLANDSPYGLAACVFTRDTERGEQVARRIEAGAVCVNDACVNYSALEAPFGGAKASGFGQRHGAGGIRKYCQQQTILITPSLTMKRELHMFPHSARRTRILGRALGWIYGRGKRD
jgi:acyl-CoA reductase-like NAD-dependent aldehyde dehydrogenase